MNEKEPNYLIPDPKEPALLYLIGRYRGKGSVIRFNKRDGQVRWHAQFEEFSTINSYSQAADDDDIFLCGHYQPNEGPTEADSGSNIEYRATMARMKDDGDVSWIITSTGNHPLESSSPADYAPQDKCMGISYFKEKEQVAVVIQGKMSDVRASYKSDYYDTILLKLNDGGETEDIVVISQGTIQYDMFAAKNGIFWVGDDIYFSGWSYGFSNERQSLVKDASSPDFDAYIYKYRFGWNNDCLFVNEPNNSKIDNRNTFTAGTAVVEENLYTYTTAYRSIPMNREENYFIPYPSRYSGGFSLLDTMKIPRPCAYQSQNLTSVQYYRG